jgi:signal transduction histidine kinase
MKMDMRWIERQLPENSTSISERLRSTIALIDEAIRSVQRISMALRPPALDDFGLSEAIKLVLTNFEKKANFTCTFVSTPQQIVLNRELSTEVFRICQEALTNIARHAEAKNVTVLLQNTGDKLIMEVKDDGRGITKKEMMDHASIGLTGMRERAYSVEGNLTIMGMRGKGTILTLSVPLNEGKERNTKTIERDQKKTAQEA